jgi:hypothetical protein
MRLPGRALLPILVTVALSCGGGPAAPTPQTRSIDGALSSVGTMAADYRVYPVDVGRPGALRASAAWVGGGALWLFVFDEEPPTTAPPLAQSDTREPTNPARVTASIPAAGRYFVLVQQSIVPAGPARGACGCVDTFTLTLTYP